MMKHPAAFAVCVAAAASLYLTLYWLLRPRVHVTPRLVLRPKPVHDDLPLNLHEQAVIQALEQQFKRSGRLEWM